MATRAELFEVIDDRVGPRGTIPASQSPAGTGIAVFLTLRFASCEVNACSGLALLKRMLDGIGLKPMVKSWQLPRPGSNRGYRPEQLIGQMIVSI
jgi:hypothetical protein